MERVALKVHRRRFSHEGRREIAIYQQLRDRVGPCREIIGLREAFVYDGHICLAFDLHGNSLCETLARGAMKLARVRRAARQVFSALDRLHRAGYVHTDLKPDNILYRARSGEARLGDLGDIKKQLRQGTLYGTREYTPPEMILGALLTPAIDVWSVGCTLYEMLTDRLLFDPRAAAARKYREFDCGRRVQEIPVAESVKKDAEEEKDEQLVRRAIVAEKYRLKSELGRGRFSTVWLAEIVSDRSVDCTRELLQCRDASRRSRQSAREQRDRQWRGQKGAADLVDLALNYEQLLLIAALCGKFPDAMIASARYRTSYFKDDGSFRFQAEPGRVLLRERLRRHSDLRGDELGLTIEFLRRCLTIDPGARITPAAALTHPWLHLA